MSTATINHPVRDNSMPTVTIVATGASPLSTAVQYTVSGSPNANENGTYDTTFFNERGILNRVIKKRYAVFGSVHIRSVAELIAVNTGSGEGV